MTRPADWVIEDGNLRVGLLALGATISSIRFAHGQGSSELVLGYPDRAGYEADRAATGVTVGRYANRIANARFRLDGRWVELIANDGRNQLHGGPANLSRRLWRAVQQSATSVTLEVNSLDGDQGFPGNLVVRLTCTVAAGELVLNYTAEADEPTVINLTNHSYFNLSGGASVTDHHLRVVAGHILEADAESIPTGRRVAVRGTPFDLSVPRRIGDVLADDHDQLRMAGGLDHNYILSDRADMDWRGTPPNVTLATDDLTLDVWTDQPGVQIYSDNHLGCRAVCLETQHFPDSPNQAAFPSTRLDPQEPFMSTTRFSFVGTDASS